MQCFVEVQEDYGDSPRDTGIQKQQIYLSYDEKHLPKGLLQQKEIRDVKEKYRKPQESRIAVASIRKEKSSTQCHSLPEHSSSWPFWPFDAEKLRIDHSPVVLSG